MAKIIYRGPVTPTASNPATSTKSAPLTVDEVDKNFFALAQAGMTGLASFQGIVSTVGIIKVDLGVSWSDTMGRYSIKGYDHSSTTGGWEVVVSGQNSTAAGGSWVNTLYEIYGNTPFTTVRVGHDGTHCVLLFGVTTTALPYEIVVFDSAQIGFAGETPFRDATQAITVVTTETGLTSLVTPALGRGGVGGLSIGSVKTANYQALVNDLVRVDSTAGIFTVTLPAAPNDGDKVGVWDVSGKCGINAVLLAASGGFTVESSAVGRSIAGANEYCLLMYNSVGTDWKISQQQPANKDVFFENSNTLSTSYTISSGKNASTIGPLTIANGVTVTIPTGSTWIVS